MTTSEDTIDGPVLLVLFIPGATRDNEPVDHRHWTSEALAVLGKRFRGGTAFPPGLGVWRGDNDGSPLMYGETTVVQCYTRRAVLDRHFGELRSFLLRMGRECRQLAVGYVVNGAYFEIDVVSEQAVDVAA